MLPLAETISTLVGKGIALAKMAGSWGFDPASMFTVGLGNSLGECRFPYNYTESSKMNCTRWFLSLAALLLCPLLLSAQLTVTVSPVKATGQKAIVPLTIKNNFTEKIESARAVVFLLDDQGKMVGQASRWVIGGNEDKAGLAPGATNAFHFVVAATKPLTTTNLTVKVAFSRVILEGGKMANPVREVKISPAPK